MAYLNKRYLYIFAGYRIWKDNQNPEGYNSCYLESIEYLDLENINKGWTIVNLGMNFVKLSAMGVISLNDNEILLVGGYNGSTFVNSIIKVSGSKIGDFNAIVLDRGGGIGFGKRFLFDLLFTSEAEASQFGTSYDVTFDLLREGY